MATIEGDGYSREAVVEALEHLYDDPADNMQAEARADVLIAMKTIQKRAPGYYRALLLFAQGYTPQEMSEADRRAWERGLVALVLEVNGDTEYARSVSRLVRAIEGKNER